MEKMLNGNLIVTEIKSEEVTKGGIIIGGANISNIKKCRVKYPDSSGVTKEGDIVIIPIHAGLEMNYENEDIIVLNVNRDILFID